MDREDLLFNLHLAHAAGRYEDMLLHLKRLMHMGYEFNDVERGLLHAAFSGLVDTKRQSIERLRRGAPSRAAAVVRLHEKYLEQVIGELFDVSQDGYYMADRMLARVGSQAAPRTCLLRFKGDLACVRSFVSTEPAKHVLAARQWYEQAGPDAAQLPAVSPTRLALVLNHAVLLAELDGDKMAGAAMARKALADALIVYDKTLPDQPRIAPLLTRLRTNLAAWAPATTTTTSTTTATTTKATAAPKVSPTPTVTKAKAPKHAAVHRSPQPSQRGVGTMATAVGVTAATATLLATTPAHRTHLLPRAPEPVPVLLAGPGVQPHGTAGRRMPRRKMAAITV